MSRPEVLAAHLVAKLVAERLVPRAIGLYAESLPRIDAQTLVETISQSNPRLRLALLGGSNSVTSRSNLPVTYDPSVANEWRNDAAAGKGDPLVVIVVGPAARLNSLRNVLPLVAASDLRDAVEAWCVRLLDTPERRAFWRAVAGRPQQFPLSVMLDVAACLDDIAKSSTAALLESEGAQLWRLGLLRQPALLRSAGPRAVGQTIRRNQELVSRLRDLSRQDRARVTTRARGDGPLAPIAAAMLSFESSESLEHLSKIDFDSALQILRKDEPDSTSEAGQAPTVRRLEGDTLALDLIVEQSGHGLGVAAKRFDAAVRPEDDGSVAPDPILVGQREVRPRPKVGTTQASSLFAQMLTADRWGGLVIAPNAPDLVGALKQASSGDAQIVFFQPTVRDHVRELLHRAVSQGIVAPPALEAWDTYAQARQDLLPHIGPLIDHPLLALAGTPELGRKAERLLSAYGAALTAIHATAEALRDRGSIEPAKRLLGRALALDVVFVRAANELTAIASPTHPFHLWRWMAFREVLSPDSDDLKTLGVSALEPLVADPPAVAPHLILSPFAVDEHVDHARVFVAVGSFAALPLFSEPTAHTLGRFRVRSLAKIVQRMLGLMPHAAFGFRLLLVDPPSLAGALEDLLALDSPLGNGPVPLHITVARTRPAPDATEEEDKALEEVSRELNDSHGSLSVIPEALPLRTVASMAEKSPQHLTVLFEPGEAKALRLGRLVPPALSPLVLPRAYVYDSFDDRLDVVIAGETDAFSTYHALFCEAYDIPRSDFVGRRSGASLNSADLLQIAQASTWLAVADQGLEPTLRIGDALRLDWRTDGGRDIVTVTAHPETIRDLVADAVRLAGLSAMPATVDRALHELVDLGGETLLSLAKPRGGASLSDPLRARAVIGVLAAVRWYLSRYPDSMVLSLDDPASRNWILGANADDRRADLFAVSSTNEGLLVDVIEVKAHDSEDAGVQVRSGRAEGKAVTQVDQVIQTLKRVLAPTAESQLTVARKEILRDQFYRAVASRPYRPEQRARLVPLLNDLFHAGPARLNGLVFRVRIASGEGSASPSEPEACVSPAGNRVGLVNLVESEVAPPAAKARVESAEVPLAADAPIVTSRTDAYPPTSVPAPTSVTKAPPVAAGFRFMVGHTAAADEVFWDVQRPAQPLNNFGFLVTGDSGAGKTQVLRSLIHELVAAGIPVCIFDFKNDYAVPEFSKGAGLRVYDVEADGLPFNPLSLMVDDRGESRPINQAHELSSICGRVFRLGPVQEAHLKKAIQSAYDQAGIKARTRSATTDAARVPSFDAVVELLNSDSKNESLLHRLSPLFDLGLFPTGEGAATSFEDLMATPVVLDLHRLPNDQIKKVIAEFIIIRLHGFVLRGEQPRALRRMLFFDEAWRVADSVRLQELTREGRAFGVGLAIGTQFPGDIPDTLVGNLATQLLLQNQNSEHRKHVVRTLCGTQSGPAAQQLLRQLDQLQTHEGFLRNQHYSPYVLIKTLPFYKRATRS